MGKTILNLQPFSCLEVASTGLSVIILTLFKADMPFLRNKDLIIHWHRSYVSVSQYWFVEFLIFNVIEQGCDLMKSSEATYKTMDCLISTVSATSATVSQEERGLYDLERLHVTISVSSNSVLTPNAGSARDGDQIHKTRNIWSGK